MNSEEKRSEVNRLSAFRGLAALLVSIGHLQQVFIKPYSSILSPYAGLIAQSSVMVFFVISGYSIASSVSRLINKPNPVYEYVLKRSCRVLPPLITSYVLMYILFVLAPYFFPTGSNNFVNEQDLARSGLYFDIKQILGSLFF